MAADDLERPSRLFDVRRVELPESLAAGYALLRAASREELARHVQKFLQVVGDGTCEIIEVMEPVPQETSAAA